jgi:hypothetical protein
MAALTDAQLEAIFTAMQGGTPIMESTLNMSLDEEASDIRRQLIAKYTQEEFRRVMTENVRPNLTPGRKARMAAMRMVSQNPDSVADIKSVLQTYIDTL